MPSTPDTTPAYPLLDADLIAADTVAKDYLTADADGVTLARAYLDLKAQVSAVLALHEETEYRYEDDADVACTVCGIIRDWPCPTVAALTANAKSCACLICDDNETPKRAGQGGVPVCVDTVACMDRVAAVRDA